MRILFLVIYLFTITAFSQDLKGTLVFERIDQDKERKQGLIDSLGNIILPAEYGSIRVTDNGKFIVATKQKGYRYVERDGWPGGADKYPDYKYGVLDADLKTVLPFDYDNIDTYRKPHYAYHEEKGTAIFDENFKELFPFKYQNVRYITNPYPAYWYLTKDGFSGVVNKRGKQIIEEKPFWIEPISQNLFAVYVKINKNRSYATTPYYLMDKDLNKINDFSFKFFQFLTPEVILFSKGDNKTGLMNTEGTILLPAEYNWIIYDEEKKVYVVRKEGKWGMLNDDLRVIVSIEYNEIKAGKNTGLFLISKDKKHGFVNTKGEIVIDMIYDGADIFSEGLAPLLKDGKWGFIDENGEVVIDFQFEGKVKSFENEYAAFYKDKKSVFINKKGEIVGEPQEGDIRYFSKDKAIRFNGYNYNSYEHLIDLKTGEIIFELKQN